MKILFLINDMRRGGAQRAFVNQINVFSGMGIDVYLMVLFRESGWKDYFDDLKIDKKKVQVLGIRNIFDFKKCLELSKFIKKEKISIVYSTLEYSNIITRLLKLICPRLKVFIRESNIAEKKGLKFKLLDLILNWLPKKIIAVSEAVRDSLLRYQKTYGHKIMVLPNGVFLPNVDMDAKFNQPKETINILNVGGLREQKNQIFLLEIFSELAREEKNIHLFVVGEGALKTKIEKYIREKGLGNEVSLVYDLSKNQEIEEFYKKVDIFVLSSLWEGCPNALLEAMSFGLPPISTKVGGATEIIEDGVSGYLVDINDKEQTKDKLKKLIKDKELRKIMGERAYKRIKDNYTIDKVVKSLIKIFNT